MRIPGLDPAAADARMAAVLKAQTEAWGAPLDPSLVYARRPSIFFAVREMWEGLSASGLLSPMLVTLVNRRVAALNGCPF